MKHLRFNLAKRSVLSLFVGAILLGGAAAFAQSHSALAPEPREAPWWTERQAAKNARVAEGNIDLLMIGDSITHGWEAGGKAVWERYYADRNTANIGFSGDRTQHVLWRLDNGNAAGISPKLAVLMIGTNNAKDNSADEIAEGIEAIAAKLRSVLPNTKLLVLAVFPRADLDQPYRDKLSQVNARIAKLDELAGVDFLDINWAFLDENGELPKSIMPDLLHPNALGYALWAEAMEPKVAELMGGVAAGQAPKGFTALFNGQDLSGWKGLVADPEKRAAMSAEELAQAQVKANESARAHWLVENGALHYDGQGESLCTARDYGDFDMLVDWRITEGGDSGLYLRGSPQVQIWDPKDRPEGSGGLFNNKKNPEKPILCADNPIGEWNTFRIRMKGERVWVWLNDALVVNNTVLENYWNRDIPIYPLGQIELQNHHSELWFKNIYLRELPDAGGWEPLFNGENLDGWQEVGGTEKTWGVEDGLLFTDGSGGGWLATEKEYGDFEVELEFRVPEAGNSGVFIRAPLTGNPAFAGSEVQVLDDAAEKYAELKPWQYCGSLYATAAPAAQATLPAGQWQKMRIRCAGPLVDVTLNGVHIVNANCDEHEDKLADHPGLARRSGHIGLQNHGSRLDYRNLRIRAAK